MIFCDVIMNSHYAIQLNPSSTLSEEEVIAQTRDELQASGLATTYLTIPLETRVNVLYTTQPKTIHATFEVDVRYCSMCYVH